MAKFLILDDIFLSWKKIMEKEDFCDISCPYKTPRIIDRILYKIGIYTQLNRFAEWKDKMYKYSVIIIFAYPTSKNLIDFVCKNKKDHQRIIVWYWNPVSKSLNPDLIHHLDCELWSFDPADCDRYKMNFNTTFYLQKLVIDSSGTAMKNDVLFLGLNKGRLEMLKSIKNNIEKSGFTSLFYIVDDSVSVYKRKPLVSYDKYLEWLVESNCVLDVVQSNQKGVTLRAMEAIFFKKKMISTTLSIIEEDFYHSDNIFVIGKDSWDDFSVFMAKPYQQIKKEIVSGYEFHNWIKRFTN